MSVPAALPGTEHHPHARMVLESALRSGSPSHAYLFHGPPGTGKRAAARALAAELLAEGSPDPDNARLRGEACSACCPDGARRTLSLVEAPAHVASVLRESAERAGTGRALCLM